MTAGRLVAAVFGLVTAACSEEVVYTSDPPWQDDEALPAIGNGKVLVTNSGSDTLSWIDVDTLEVVFTQPVGRLAPEREGIHHGAVSPDGRAIFVGVSNFVPGGGTGPHGSHGTGSVPGWMLKYDLQTHELLGQTLVERNPGDVRTTADGRLVLQTHFDLTKVTEYLSGNAESPDSPLAIIDARAMGEAELLPICPATHGMAIAPDSKTAYVSCFSSDEIAKVGLTKPYTLTLFKVGAAAGSISSPSYEPYAVSISPVDGSLWVSALKTGDIRVLDPSTGELIGEPISLNGGAPFFTTFTSDGATLLVPVQGKNSLDHVDTATRTVISQALPDAACSIPHGVLVLPGDEFALVVCEGDRRSPGTVAVVNLATRAVDSFIEVGVYPDDLILVAP